MARLKSCVGASTDAATDGMARIEIVTRGATRREYSAEERVQILTKSAMPRATSNAAMNRAPDMAAKLRRIAEDIRQSGSVNLTRLTVLKKWLELPGRLASFGVFIACQACLNADRATGEAATLLDETRTLLADTDFLAPNVPSADAMNLRGSLAAFQSKHQNVHWTSVRVIHDWNLYLIESGLGLCLDQFATSSEGYRLAAAYCEHYDPKYGETLNGPSAGRIEDIAGFVHAVEAYDAASAIPQPRPVLPASGSPRTACRRRS